MSTPAVSEYQALFAAHGGTDVPYLKLHFHRYTCTKRRLLSHWDRGHGNKLLDVGAHWLHQSLLYALDGFAVTALDTPTTLDDEHVRALAEQHGIQLLRESSLDRALALRALPESYFDVVLFTEIIEHLAFNPVAMWREIYRVMKPGARIVVTTPNYYALRGRAWHWLRFLRGQGSGVEVTSLLNQPTFAHHWKEYSLGELIRYFRLLSPDFEIVSSAHVVRYSKSEAHPVADAIAGAIERVLPLFRPNLYLEIELARKDKGIVIEPHW